MVIQRVNVIKIKIDLREPANDRISGIKNNATNLLIKKLKHTAVIF